MILDRQSREKKRPCPCSGPWPSFFFRHRLGEFLIDDQATDQKYKHHTDEHPQHIHDTTPFV